MNNDFKNWCQESQKQGMTITKEKLLESITRTSDLDFSCVADPASKYMLVQVPLMKRNWKDS